MNRFRFVHLNVHSHYSINDGCASIKELVDTAIKDKMPGVAITDNGNMFGMMEFSTMFLVLTMKDGRRGRILLSLSLVVNCMLHQVQRRTRSLASTAKAIA